MQECAKFVVKLEFPTVITAIRLIISIKNGTYHGTNFINESPAADSQISRMTVAYAGQSHARPPSWITLQWRASESI